MTMKRVPADAVFSGSGTLLDAIAGAGACLETRYDFKRLAGTSGGSAVACARAHGMAWEAIKDLGKEILSGNLLDLSTRPWDRWGLVKGNVIYNALLRHFPGYMGDAELPWCCYATDLWGRRVVQFSSWGTPHIKSADAVRASIAIPVFFKGVYLQADLKRPPRFFVDGGVGANFAMDAFDDVPERPTIGVRFRPQHAGKVQPPVKLTGADLLWPPKAAQKAALYAGAILDTLLESGVRAHMSKKNWASEVRIDAKEENGMDFWLSGADVDKRWDLGYASAEEFLRNRGAL
jgi:predicted acylesterase/phospholipase RssA